jgi:hypothetical protein
MASKKTQEQVNEDIMNDVAEAALDANKQIQEGAMDGLVKGANPMNPPGGSTHYVPYSNNLGTGGTGFQDGNQTRAIQNIREADKAYREVGIVRNVVDIMTDFTAEGLNIHHPVAAQERFYRAWMNKVAMSEVAKQSLRGMYKWANVGIFRFWGKIRPKTRKEMMAKARQLFAEGNDREAIKAFFREDKTVRKGRIPIRYSCLPPFRVRITGSILFDTRYYNYAIAENDRMKLLNPEKFMGPEERYLSKEIPESLRMRIQKDSRIPLLPEHFTMLHYKRDCSRLWADPIILPIMNDLRYKQVLRRLDISVAESIINPITIFKLGKTVEGFAPTKDQFQNLANLLKTPVATKTLVWSDLIEVEQHIVDAKEVFTTEKYKEVDIDILNGLGVSLTLINGGAGGSQGKGQGAQAFLSVRTLLERLEDGRQEFMKFLNQELELVRKAMGWKRSPVVTWDQMNLRDEAARERIMIELRDRKIISNETLLDMLDMNNDIEMSRKKREAKATDKSGIIQSVGPFEEQVRVQKNEDPARLTIDVNKQQMENQKDLSEKQMKQNEDFKKQEVQMQKEIKKEQIKNKNAPQAGPGRPGGKKGDEQSRKQKKKRDTKPAGMGVLVEQDLIDVALDSRAVIDHYLKPRFLESVGKGNLRQLTKDEKNTYNKMVEAIWSFTYPQSEKSVTEEFVAEMADQIACGAVAPDDKDKEVFIIYGELVGEYREENHRFPSERISRELFAKALVLRGV